MSLLTIKFVKEYHYVTASAMLVDGNDCQILNGVLESFKEGAEVLYVVSEEPSLAMAIKGAKFLMEERAFLVAIAYRNEDRPEIIVGTAIDLNEEQITLLSTWAPQETIERVITALAEAVVNFEMYDENNAKKILRKLDRVCAIIKRSAFDEVKVQRKLRGYDPHPMV